MNRDLFGQVVLTVEPDSSRWLREQDAATFDARLTRAKYVLSIYPSDTGFLLPPESFYVMNEAGQAFINGQDVATVLLAQAFVEHMLQLHLDATGQTPIGKRGLKAILKHLRAIEPQHEYVLGLVDEVRKFRNPFTHLRGPEDPDRLMRRAIRDQVVPEEIIEHEAKRALAVMYQVALTKF